MGQTTSSSGDNVLDSRVASHIDGTFAGFPIPPWLAPGATVVGVPAGGAVVADGAPFAPFVLFGA